MAVDDTRDVTREENEELNDTSKFPRFGQLSHSNGRVDTSLDNVAVDTETQEKSLRFLMMWFRNS